MTGNQYNPRHSQREEPADPGHWTDAASTSRTAPYSGSRREEQQQYPRYEDGRQKPGQERSMSRQTAVHKLTRHHFTYPPRSRLSPAPQTPSPLPSSRKVEIVYQLFPVSVCPAKW
ncbi:hypothetical protein ACOMHN_059905 [Nucella lapillus]